MASIWGKSIIRVFDVSSIAAQAIRLSHQNAGTIIFARGMAQYNPFYRQPTYNPQKIKELHETGESEKLKFSPIKAALTNQTSSLFHDPIAAKFCNYIMKTGQRSIARELLDQTFETIKRIQLQKYHQSETSEEKAKIECNPIEILHKALSNAQPILMTVPIKRGGTKYQVPTPITDKHSKFMAMRWFIEAGRDKHRTMHFPEKMAQELIQAANFEGRVIKKKLDLHKLCEANRAYAHYRWS